ncbi:MAG TPA: energy transducer TonB [Terriglobales bacterium]
MKRALISGLLTLLSACTVAAQNKGYTPETPVVKSAEMPLYPHLARMARIEGTVGMEVTTDGMAVTNITASGAHKLLLDAAEHNVRTWKFYRHKPQTFRVTFTYKLEKPEVFGFVNPTVLLELPNRVEIRTKMHPVETTGTH